MSSNCTPSVLALRQLDQQLWVRRRLPKVLELRTKPTLLLGALVSF